MFISLHNTFYTKFALNTCVRLTINIMANFEAFHIIPYTDILRIKYYKMTYFLTIRQMFKVLRKFIKCFS
jgi:hypothetical protein